MDYQECNTKKYKKINSINTHDKLRIFHIGTLLILIACVCVCVCVFVGACVHACALVQVCAHRCMYVHLGVVLLVQMGC